MNEYPLDHNIKLSAEEMDIQIRRRRGEVVPESEIRAAEARTIKAHWEKAGKAPPESTRAFIRKWLGDQAT